MLKKIVEVEVELSPDVTLNTTKSVVVCCDLLNCSEEMCIRDRYETLNRGDEDVR